MTGCGAWPETIGSGLLASGLGGGKMGAEAAGDSIGGERVGAYWESAAYWSHYEYDRRNGCLCYGGPNQYSWGWVVDDFGSAVMPWEQVTGFGMYESSLEVH